MEAWVSSFIIILVICNIYVLVSIMLKRQYMEIYGQPQQIITFTIYTKKCCTEQDENGVLMFI